VGDIRSGEERAQYTVDFTINPDFKAKPVKEDGTADEIAEGSGYTFTKGENEKYVFILTDGEGNEHKTETDKMPATIQDKDGNIYEVDEKGEIKPLSKNSNIQLDPAVKDKQSNIAVLSFRATGNTKYALDEYRDIYKKVTEYNDQYTLEGTTLASSAKFMPPGTSDEIEVYIRENGANRLIPEKVRFVTGKGREYQAVYDKTSQTWTLTVVAGNVNDGWELYVVQEESEGRFATLGKLNIFTYELLERKITLVSVNGAMNGLNRQSVESGLNNIYGKIGIRWTVDVSETPFGYTPKNGSTFNVTGSGLLSTLTDDMKAVNEAFKQSGQYQEDGLYLFILPYRASDKGEINGTNGDMPLGSQFGYLFPGADIHTIAHEAGHGAFNLEHPFDRPLRNSFEKGALTDNLMDYTAGTEFAKIQWDQTRAPGLVIGLFQKDKSGMSGSKFVDIEKFWKWIKETQNSNNKNIEYNYLKFRYDFKGTKSIEDISLNNNDKIELMVEFFANNGNVNMSKSKFNIKFENYHTTFALLFQTDKNENAFELQVNSFYEYTLLLQDLNIEIDYKNILSQYDEAFKNAGSDCDKLDVIYERIPIYISLMKDDNVLVEHLLNLSDCAIDNIGTSESVAAVKLLSSIKNPNILYSKLFPCPKAYERKEQGWYHTTRTDVFNVKFPEFLKALFSNFGGGIGYAFGIADGVYGLTQDHSADNAIGIVNQAESSGVIFRKNPTLDEALYLTADKSVTASAYLLEKFGEAAAKDPIVGKNQQWFKNYFGKGGYIIGKGWGILQVYFMISDLTPTKKQYMDKMLFDCMKYCVTGTSEAVGGTGNYLNIPHHKFDNINEVQTYLEKMWQVILDQSLGKLINNDTEYSNIKKEVLNILANDKYFYEKR